MIDSKMKEKKTNEKKKHLEYLFFLLFFSPDFEIKAKLIYLILFSLISSFHFLFYSLFTSIYFSFISYSVTIFPSTSFLYEIIATIVRQNGFSARFFWVFFLHDFKISFRIEKMWGKNINFVACLI